MIGYTRLSVGLIIGAALLHHMPIAAAEVAKKRIPVLIADIDGDGKRDQFYRFQSGTRVEFGVSLTKFGGKYTKVDDASVQDFKNLVFKRHKRHDFIAAIKCSEHCSDYRESAISALGKSVSPEVVEIYTEESAGSVVFLDRNGRVKQEWYSD